MQEFILAKPSKGEYKEKGSSFYAVFEPASSADHVKSILLKLKEQFPNASHICYAYRIKKDKSMDEFHSDASEPPGSAGIPILNVLKRNQIVNAVIFVIRYFCGTKLGVTRLSYAYGITAEDAIKNAKMEPCIDKKRLLITYPYKLEGIIKSILKKNRVEVIHEDFSEKIDIQLEIDVKSTNEFIDSIKELSARFGQIILTE